LLSVGDLVRWVLGTPQRLCEQGMVGVITCVARAMAPHDPAAGREHESAAKLMPVLFGSGLGAVTALSLAIKANAPRAPARYALRRKAKDLTQRAAW
jgi:hypothetical protein